MKNRKPRRTAGAGWSRKITSAAAGTGHGRGQYIRTKPLHPSQHITAETAEALEISLRVRPNPELETLLLSFGEDVEVLAPPPLRARLGERLRTAAGLYG